MAERSLSHRPASSRGTVSSSVSQRLAETPELVSKILAKFDDPQALVKLAQVSTVWCHESMWLLWRGDQDEGSKWRSPNIEWLIMLLSLRKDDESSTGSSNSKPLQYYLGLVNELTFHSRRRRRWPIFGESDPGYVMYGRSVVGGVPNENHVSKELFAADIWTEFKGKSITFQFNQFSIDTIHLQSLINPALQALDLQCCSGDTKAFDDSLLRLLQRRCSLRMFIAPERLDDKFSLQALQSFVQHNPLEYFVWKNDLDDTQWYEPLMSIFAQKELLEHLELRAYSFTLPEEWVSTPFQRLQSLALEVCIDFDGGFLSDLPNLQSFKLVSTDEGFNETWDINEELLFPITGCEQLRDLTVAITGVRLSWSSTHAAFKVLSANCGLLESIYIAGPTQFQHSNFEAADFIRTLQDIPHLKAIRLDVNITNLDADSLVGIARSCPDLRKLRLYSELHVDILDNTNINFLHLNSLCVQKLSTEQSAIWEACLTAADVRVTIKERILRCMPNLKFFQSVLADRAPDDWYTPDEILDYSFSDPLPERPWEHVPLEAHIEQRIYRSLR